jgi:hypothetical protein
MHSPFCFLNFLLEIPFEIRWNFFSGTFPDFFLEVFPAFNEPGIPGMKGKSPVLHYMVIILLIRGSSGSWPACEKRGSVVKLERNRD